MNNIAGDIGRACYVNIYQECFHSMDLLNTGMYTYNKIFFDMRNDIEAITLNRWKI